MNFEEDSFRFLFANAPVGVLYAATDETIQSANPYLAALFGIDSEMNLKLGSLPALRSTRLLEDFYACVRSSETIVGECETATVPPLRLRYYFLPYSEGGVVRGARAIVVDVTERKLAEDRAAALARYFDSVVESMSPLATLTPQNHVQFLNPAFSAEFNAPLESSVGKSLFEVMHLADEERIHLADNIARVTPGNPRSSEIRHEHQVYGYTAFAFPHGTGIILRNLTHMRRLETRVEELHSRLLQSREEEQQRIAAELHDSVGQTILAAKLNLVASKTDASPQKEERFQTALELIDQASQQLREIYTNLYPNLLNDLGLEAAIRSFVRGFLALKVENVILRIALKRPLSRDVQLSLYRILQEVCGNIVKHAHAGNVWIVLFARGSRASLYVRDDGRGFSPVDRRRGFGLDNIRRRVEDLDGTVAIRSEQGRGSRFLVRIPLKE